MYVDTYPTAAILMYMSDSHKSHLTVSHLWSCFTSGLMWSVTYLGAVEVVHHYTSASVALLASYPIKIAWGFVHSWTNRWRGAKSVTLTVESH